MGNKCLRCCKPTPDNEIRDNNCLDKLRIRSDCCDNDKIYCCTRITVVNEESPPSRPSTPKIGEK